MVTMQGGGRDPQVAALVSGTADAGVPCVS